MFFFVLLCFAPYHRGAADVVPFFSPSTDCENRLVAMVASARASVDVAAYALNNEKITNALLAVDRNKIHLRILADKLQASGKNSRVKQLHNAGVDIRVHSVHRIQHNKYVVVDDKKIMTGSFNFTESASKHNAENCVFITDNQPVADAYQRNFNKLWTENTKEKSDAWFESR